MKYLKITLSFLMFSLVLTFFNASAQDVNLVDITIPSFSATTIAKKAGKSDFNTQYIKKTRCTDDISGDGRVIKAGLHETTGNAHPNGDPSWVIASPNQKVAFDYRSKEAGSWNLYLASQKWFVTTASFWGTWTVD